MVLLSSDDEDEEEGNEGDEEAEQQQEEAEPSEVGLPYCRLHALKHPMWNPHYLSVFKCHVGV